MGREELVTRAHGFTTAVAAETTALVAAARSGAPMTNEVHRFRVALRRLRSVARILLASGPKKQRVKAEELLRETANVTGEARDEEVLAETLAELRLPPATREALELWQVGRARRLDGTRRRAVERLTRDFAAPLRRALRAVDAAIDGLPIELGTPASLEALTTERANKLATRWADATRVGSAEAFHRARISAKKLRYLAEWLSEDPDLPLDEVANGCAKIQKTLGRLHDLQEATLRMERARGLDAAHRELILAELARLTEKCERKAREDVSRTRARVEERRAHAFGVLRAATSARAIEERRDALPDTDAEGGGAALVVEPDHVGEERRDDAGARAPDGVAERDGTA